MKQTFSKTVSLNLDGFKGRPTTLLTLFKDKAKQEGWTDNEINEVVTEAERLLDYDHLIETIRSYCTT